MNLTELLENLSAKNVELWIEGDKLRYRGPENALSPELLASMKQYKPEILRILSQSSDGSASYPLSQGQKALWFLYQLAPESSAYNITYAAKLVTNLEISALEQAAQALVERHPVLRTTFTTIDGEPVQTVHKHQPVDFSVENAFALSPDDINDWLLQTSACPFNLEVGPLLRWRVLINHTPTPEQILLITQHHIITDFWSSEIMLDELKVLYEALTKDTEPLLPVHKCEYRDYLNWSAEMLSGSKGESLWNYWRQQLCGELPVLNLPTDRPRPHSQSYRGDSLFFRLEEKLQQSLTQLAKKKRASLYMVLLTALQILLFRYTSQEDILIGSPMVNRRRLEFEKILGYFTNPVVLRANLSGNPSFEELLGRTRLCVLDALEHQEYPFPLLVERLQPVRDPSYSPLYQVAFAWDRPHQSGEESLTNSDGLVVESITTPIKGAAFDLTLSILHESEALTGTWNYNSDLFERITIERMSGHFVTLLEAIVANPGERISQLPLLTASEQQQLLVEWNQTLADYPHDKCIHQLFEEQVERTPNAVALVYENQQLTYGELNCRANQLAQYLRSLGVGTGVLVGICVQRSLSMVVGLLGILKAGGAYVPLDPDYPTERLSFMLEDARISVLLTQQSLLNKLPQHQTIVVGLDTDWQLISQSTQDNPISEVQATDLAYVIYTSGSTGQPKGVEVIHRGVNRLLFGVDYVHLDATQKWLQMASISFDASTFEIWGALLHGGLCVIFPESIPTAKNLSEAIDKHGITVVWLTAALFNAIVDENVQALSGIRQLLIGGEALSVAHVHRALEKLPSTQIINGYGPTESTTFTCCHPLGKQLQRNIESIPLGRPIANTQVYILDKYLQPVPVGVPGELHIGGAGLARGYLNRPQLTAEKFIPNPLRRSRGAQEHRSRGVKEDQSCSERLYKTGDLARFLSDGNIEYLGRIDNQVKIRGFRIELGEIEAVLGQNDDVQSSCVIAREDTPGDKYLVAYIVPLPQVTPTLSVLRSFLIEKLPEYMVPNAFVFLEALPLTPNGKVDRRALPTPDRHSGLPEKSVAPRTPTEEMLAQIWAQVLKVEAVGRHDRFFELGGHSLLATQLVSRIRSVFKVELPLRSLFVTPTVAELGQQIQQLQQQNAQLNDTPILPRLESAELPLSFAQQRLWFLDQLEPNKPSYNIPAALRLQGTLCVAALKQSLVEIIHRHEALRTNFITVDGQATQLIHPNPNWKVSVLDLQQLPSSEQETTSQQLAQLQAIEPFDLATETLIRATLVLLSQTEHVLLVCMHHIVCDGWSISVFVEELAALYNAYCEGKPSPLAPLPIQYADFAIWQRQWLLGEVRQSQLSYWLQQLEYAPTFLPLPTDRPRGAVQSFAGASQTCTLSVELTQKLTLLSQEQGCTLFMTLLAAFDTLLYRYTGVADILVGSPIANRHRSEIEGLIGFFVNTLVLRADLSGNPSFNELLLRIRSMALSAYAHQDLPFEMLVEALQPERDLSHTPLFQVMFALQNAPTSVVDLTELTLSLLPVETATTKFDLTLSMENTPTGLVGEWEYNTDLFDGSTIERMSSHFVTLLEAIVANPSEQISQLPLLTLTEQQQLLVEWNDTRVDYPVDKCIHELFEEQVARTPNAVAIVFENQQLTYGELNSDANQLAHYLRSRGVGANVLVGICVERSIEMVVGLLGILKAGGAYVPLDPEYPTERLSFMLEDAQVSVLLTQQHLVEKFPSHQAQVVCLETQWQVGSQFSGENPTTVVRATDLAYTIYTSGSTGTPKGVPIAYEALLNLVFWHQRTFEIASSDRATQLAGTGFDAAVWEIWPYLTVGASLYLVKSELVTEPVNLQQWLIDNKITITFVPTPVAIELLSLEWKTQNLALRYLLTGGDKLHQYPSASVPFSVVNNYGPTENTVVTTSGQIVAREQLQTSPPIGRPIANTQVYILDKHLQPVPIGVPGELHIGGASLARGYLNRPELTQEKFIPNPLRRSRGAQEHRSWGVKEDQSCSERLYKTGDLARFLSDGNIEYLGRIDNQVKIRGFRIELGEIEAVLSQHEHVQSSVVVARVDIPGNKRLVAYIVPQKHVRPTLNELRSFLKEKLPDYMVPSVLVLLESLPLTPNGKVDRRALPIPESRTGIEDKFVAPRTPVEAKLAEIWAQVLRVEAVGIHDNFFSLGGDSILSIQIIAKAKLVGIELSLKQLFANQTIAELATVALTTKALFIEQGLVTGASPLTPIQRWFFEQQLPQPHHFNQSFLLTVPTDIKIEFLEVVWKELLKHHDALRLRFTQTESNWQQVHAELCDRNIISCFDFSTLPDSEQQRAIENTANSLQASLNLSENLVQVALFRLGVDKGARLLIIIHHLVVDGVSWRILLEDLVAGYSQLCQGKVIQLPAKTTSFKDWAQHLREYAQANHLKSELDYWLSISNAAVASIPADHAHGANTVASTCTVSVSLNSSETQALLQDVPKAYKTQINDVLLTALVLAVSRWVDSKSVLFNLEGHGREDIIEGVDLSRTVGWFTTMFPVVLKLSDTENLGQVLKSVKEQLRAIPNKGIGYGLLRYLNQDAVQSGQLDKVPKAQISFNYLGQFTQVLNREFLISLADESSGKDQSLQGQRSTSLDINAVIADQQLQIHWTYSRNLHAQTTIEHLASEFVCELQNLIAHCLEPDNVGYTPTDFPLIQLDQSELDLILAKVASNVQQSQIHWQNLEDIYSLSPMQEGMLFESLYAPDTGVYFEQIACTFAGNLNVRAFEQAWQMVVARHSIFRTAFAWESLSTPVQIVYRQLDVSINTLDWRGLTKTEQQAQLETFLDEEQKQGFQLHQAPLMRLHLLRLDENTYQFVWCHHHILLDGWSLPLVFQDLFVCYQAICDGESVSLPATVNYRNYISWLQQQDLNSAKEFWQQKLFGFSAPTPLRVDKPLSQRQQHSRYDEQHIHLSALATSQVVDFVKQHQLTLNNLVQVSWGLLLSRYSGETDVVFGATLSGRPPTLLGVESMVGIFINTVPVRLQISPNTDLLSLLKDLQTQQVESEEFSYCSLVEIQGVSDIPRGTPLFESIVVFENYPVDTAVLENNGSLTLSNFWGIEHTNYPLTVVAIPGEQLCLKVSYDTNRFERGTIDRMLGHFVTLLSAIVTNPHQPIEQLPLLTASEQQQLLVEWNDTQVDYPVDKCIHQLFEEQVARTPNAVAVVFEEQQLTYYELNSRANQLAHELHSLGVGADVLVGICVERSLSMVVGLLGILKAGGAYVPLDPEYPQERLSFMVQDAQLSVLVTQQHLVERLPEHTACLVYLETQHQEPFQTQTIPFVAEVKSSNLAYVLYTSGSTGKPKAVAIEHHSAVALASWAKEVFTPEQLAGVLASTSICFDLSVFELFVTLSVGGKVIVAENALRLFSIPAANQVTLINTVPSAIAQLIREQDLPQQLCTVNLAGEALQNQLVQQIYQHSQTERVLNLYGPSEDTTYSTYSSIEKGASTAPTIGRPIANTQVYILDSHLQPVPVGVPGELHISGAGLARGYLNRPQLTAEKFIPNPFRRSRGAGTQGRRVLKEDQSCSERLYKTGDLARYLSDGNIEYLGRIDNQVKIRGFRIELGEIEAVLGQNEYVESSVVIAREDIPGDLRLVAYIVPLPQVTPTLSVLRSFLSKKLPEYMVPNAFVFLEALPLTPNGKVDRRALPTPDRHSELPEKYVAPRTATEEMLAQLWAQVLKVEAVGRHDNFFDLGGHSLLATQLVSRIRSVFKVELSLRSLFTTPTVAELGQQIQQLQRQNAALNETSILPRSESAELPLSFAQQRLWFLDQLEPNKASYNVPAALRLQGNLCVTALEQSLVEIIDRHEALRTNFITVDGQATQLIHPNPNWKVSVVDLQHLPSNEQEIASQQLAQQQAIEPFDLATEALIKATLVVLSQTEHVLLVCMHHIVCDGWSIGVFVEELAALYNAYCEGQPSPLVPLPIQYADFAIWQRQWFQNEVRQSQLSYWLQQLEYAPTFLPLPTDRPRGAVQTFAGAYQKFALSVELTQKLIHLSQEQGCTLFMTLLAAFDTLLSRYTGVADILVGSPIANRHRSEIESLIGFFVNTLVLRTDLSGDPSFNELLTRIRSMALSAYAHQDLPFEMLVEALQPERDLSHTPLFQVMFDLQNAPTSVVELTGLRVSSLPIETATTKFDLTITMENTPTGLVGGWEYNTDLFDGSTIERMIGHFVTLLEAIVANPNEQISQLPLLTLTEQQQLLVEWNDTRVDYPVDKCIHELFEEQVARTPNAVAIVFENQQLTYSELNSRANQLAHYLRSRGVGANVLVGICVERSLSMVVGLLAILKAGGAYVPLDPEYPQDRLSFMLEDAQVSVLLTQQHLVEKFPSHPAQVVCLDTHWQLVSQFSGENPATVVRATDLAYTIYTSGSTGTPKGVPIAYEGLLNLVFWHQRTFDLASSDRATQLAGTG
ncbi:non-ribosomal peptide synthetase, partial [Scytonema hofmannii]|uniref:non-ribosomal peptide synthetase n=1 Tax=Scytonema hofmannii TaxID=34078 RepID=UPI0011DF0AE6